MEDILVLDAVSCGSNYKVRQPNAPKTKKTQIGKSITRDDNVLLMHSYRSIIIL